MKIKNGLFRNVKKKAQELDIENKNDTKREIKTLPNNSLISLEQFKKYLKKKNKLLNEYGEKRYLVETNSAIRLREKRYTKYVSIDSDLQISSLYNQKVKIIYKNRINEMLVYFVGKLFREFIEILAKHNKNDAYILEFIKKHYKPAKTYISSEYKMAKIADKIKKYSSSSKPKILDVGTGNGKKIKMIKSMINCKIYGADLKCWGPYCKNKKFNFPFKYIEQKPYKIPYKDNMFDCITLILTLHHSDNIIETINECKRILKKDGIIVIVEHDIWDDYDNMIIDIQHRIYTKLFDENITKATYYNFIEWDILFDTCDMVPIYGDRISEDISYKLRYDLQFIGIYKNK